MHVDEIERRSPNKQGQIFRRAEIEFMLLGPFIYSAIGVALEI